MTKRIHPIRQQAIDEFLHGDKKRAFELNQQATQAEAAMWCETCESNDHNECNARDEALMPCGHSYDELTTMGTSLCCRICDIMPMVREVIKEVK